MRSANLNLRLSYLPPPAPSELSLPWARTVPLIVPAFAELEAVSAVARKRASSRISKGKSGCRGEKVFMLPLCAIDVFTMLEGVFRFKDELIAESITQAKAQQPKILGQAA